MNASEPSEHSPPPKKRERLSKRLLLGGNIACKDQTLHGISSGLLTVVAVVVSHIQRIGCQPEKTTLHGGQSRSWSAPDITDDSLLNRISEFR